MTRDGEITEMVDDSNNPFTGKAKRVILETIKAEIKDDPDALMEDLEWQAGKALFREFPEMKSPAFSKRNSLTDVELAWINGVAHALLIAEHELLKEKS